MVSGVRCTLNIDTPFLRTEFEGLQRTLLTQSLGLVDELVSTIVSRAGVTFRVLVLHGRAKGFEDRLGGEVLGWDEVHKVSLPGFLLWRMLTLL